jgi:hypothetical protein
MFVFRVKFIGYPIVKSKLDPSVFCSFFNHYLMENTIIIAKEIGVAFSDFSKNILEDKYLILKRLSGNKFELKSVDNYGNFNMIEKEDYYISGQLVDKGSQTAIKYTLRANVTFRILSFLIIPLMGLPTLALSLSNKINTESKSTGLVVYFGLIILSNLITFVQEKKLKLKGEKEFQHFIKTLKE